MKHTKLQTHKKQITCKNMTQTLEYLKNSFTLNIDIVKTITQHKLEA